MLNYPNGKKLGLYDVPVSRLGEMAVISSRAFTHNNDPIGNYMFELEPDREKLQLDFFRSLASSVPVDSVLQASSRNLEAISIWFKPENKDEGGGHEESKEAYSECSKETRTRVLSVVETIESLIKECVPVQHWYLHLVAAKPEFMGKGYTSRLLRQMLSFADSQELPSTLVTQHEANIALYEHLGFRVVKSREVPSTNLHFWFMKHDVKED